MHKLQPGSELAGFRIAAIEREDGDVAVLLAHDLSADRDVALHVAGEPPGALATVRFMERARRLKSVEHPHLLGIYDAHTLEGRCVAIAQAPPGRRLDHLTPGFSASVKIVRQVASAVDALEEAGAEPPPLITERIWVDSAGDAHLDGLDSHTGLPAVPSAASSSAALVRLLGELTPRAPSALQRVMSRASDGAYLSAGQLASELGAAEADASRRRRLTAILVAATVALVVLVVLLEILV